MKKIGYTYIITRVLCEQHSCNLTRLNFTYTSWSLSELIQFNLLICELKKFESGLTHHRSMS